MKLWNAVELLLAGLVCLVLIGPLGVLVLVLVGFVIAFYRAYRLEVLRRRMVAAQEARQAALERLRIAEQELAEAQERAREAGWYVLPEETFSAN
jgi:hypothetical protein